MTPEEKAALKVKHAADNAAKAARRADKKAKYDNTNYPVIEMRIPWRWADEPSNGPIRDKEIVNIDGWVIAHEHLWRVSQRLRGKPYDGPVRHKIIRT